jgi:hypothetical protein
MTDLGGLNLNDEPAEVSHEFQVDLNCLVIANHRFTIEGIERAENEDMSAAESMLEGETDYDTVSSVLSSYRNSYDDFKVAARNLTLVGLVTRFHHWAGAYARRVDPKRKRGLSLREELNFLKDSIGEREETKFFLDVEEVRNSVIHADSQPQWDFKGKIRKVEPRYAPNSYRVEVSEEDLAEAIQKAIAQIEWYDQKLTSLRK